MEQAENILFTAAMAGYFLAMILNFIFIGAKKEKAAGIAFWIQCAGLALHTAALVIRALYLRRVAEAFGRGIGFMVGLFFLRPVFLAILAFGPAPYYGDSGSPTGQIVPATSWICPVCHTANPMHRDSCENCGRRAGIE